MSEINDQATASDSFGVVSTPAPGEAYRVTSVGDPVVIPAPHWIEPAEPTVRRRSGRVEFPGGIYLAAPGTMVNTPIYVEGVNWMSRGVAQQLAASLAGAVKELDARTERDIRFRG